MGTIRTFIAFDSPDVVRERIREIQNELRKIDTDIRWESPDKFHVTIKFLGDVEEAVLPDVLTDIQTICKTHTPFDVIYSTFGSFPNFLHPRVLWLGCKNPDDKLQLLKNALDTGLVSHGFEIEERAFHPHITLGRVKSNRGLQYLTPMLEKLTFEPHSARINGINVMQSVLKPQGASHTALCLINL
ncbi:MAG: RNA 2',3'-cyclic phosphodiesterase [Ignavibacteriae bacterium]|nr:RNA 2',3'-cyclic phosphodiesterase [Ignavibacteria bacterium]MBI3363990.1 RNA 2',3'-cyclic phosphodiesterase [Ignavibacteriota bacterium]